MAYSQMSVLWWNSTKHGSLAKPAFDLSDLFKTVAARKATGLFLCVDRSRPHGTARLLLRPAGVLAYRGKRPAVVSSFPRLGVHLRTNSSDSIRALWREECRPERCRPPPAGKVSGPEWFSESKSWKPQTTGVLTQHLITGQML